MHKEDPVLGWRCHILRANMWQFLISRERHLMTRVILDTMPSRKRVNNFPPLFSVVATGSESCLGNEPEFIFLADGHICFPIASAMRSNSSVAMLSFFRTSAKTFCPRDQCIALRFQFSNASRISARPPYFVGPRVHEWTFREPKGNATCC